MEPLEALQGALNELRGQRAQLDEDIADLERIISRRGGKGGSAAAVQTQLPTPAPVRRQQVAAFPGEARREILDLMADGGVWTPSMLAQQRGTSPNAATRALKRMLKESPPPIRNLGHARYKLASKGDAQGSLSA